MTLPEFILVVLLSAVTTLLGWYGRDFLDDRIRRRRRARLEKKQQIIKKYAPGWLIEYYARKSEGDNLATLPNGKKIPYLSRPEWRFEYPLSSKVKYSIDEQGCSVSIDRKAIRDREVAGQRLWDGEIFCLGGIVVHGNCFEIVLRKCSYLQYASVSANLESEVFHCLRRSRKAARLRDKMAGSLSQLEGGMLNAQVVGFTTAFVLESKGRFQVLIQRRSREIGIAQGMLAVVPSFVCGAARYSDACLPLDRHFFLLELLEELYGQEELELDDRYLASNWFYQRSPADRIVPLLEKEGPKSRFKVLGFGFDLHTGELNVATCFIVRESELREEEMYRMRFNWEIRGVEPVALENDSLRELIVCEDMYVTSAFTLSCLSRIYQSGELGICLG